MNILLQLHRSVQNRRFAQALRKRDVHTLMALAGDGSLRLSRDQILSAACLLIEEGRPGTAAALLQNALLAEPGQAALISALNDAVRLIARTAAPAAAEELAQRADNERDAGNFLAAAALYEEALAIAPGAAHWRVQFANMLKDSGQFAAAEIEYRRAQLERPEDADIPLQLGRALRMAGRIEEARESFREAQRRAPANRAASDELARLGAPQDYVGQTLAAFERGEPFALFALADAVAGLKESFSRIEKLLPSASAGSAFPPLLHDLFRRSHSPPAAPVPQATLRLAVLFDADAGTERSFHARLDALLSMPNSALVLAATVTAPKRRDHLMRRAAPESGRYVLCRDGFTLATLSALIREHDCQGLLILDGEAVPDPVAPGWFAFALESAEAAYADGESGRLGPDWRIERYEPILRSRHDAHRGEAEPGRAFALRREVLTEISAAMPMLQPTIAALYAIAASRAAPVHIPLFLACDLGTTPSGSPVTIPASARSEAMTRIGCVIPTRDYPDDAERFVRSLRATAAQPEALSIVLVDNGVRGEGAAALTRLSSEGIKILHDHEAFNWSRINNRAAAELDEEQILLFANDDMEMLTPDWDNELRGVLAFDGVGVAGAKLLYPDRTIQHAGILCSWAGRPEHEGRGEPEDAAGPADRWLRRRTALAVTGAFLATRRADFEAVGGFDPDFPFGFNDVDFCLRLRERGRSTVYTPCITLIHHESKTRGRHAADPDLITRAAAEDARFFARWPTHVVLDPTLNPNWSDAFAPFRAYRSPTGVAVQNYINEQQASERV